MKVFIFGASGLLGYSVCQVALRRNLKIKAFYNRTPIELPELKDSQSFDVTNTDQLQRLLFDEWPDVVVNAAAISKPDDVDSNPERSYKINVTFPKILSQLCNHIGAKLIHISTDMVFDGTSPEYRSTSVPLPLTPYGQQKLLAEKEVLKNGGSQVVVLRSTILNGNSMSFERSLHESLLHSIKGGKKLHLFTDEFRQPCHASNLAEVIVELCEREDLHGIFHWGGTELLSRYEIGMRILKKFALPTDSIIASTHHDLPEGVHRPKSIKFVLEPLFGKLKTQPQNFSQQLEDLHLSWDLYQWFRSVSLDPTCYKFRIKA